MAFYPAEGDIFVISGPSGSGKSTIRNKLLQALPDLTFTISHTTRSPRSDKGDKTDYHFVTQKQFEEMISKGEFVEWAEVHGDLYGTSIKELESALKKGALILLEIDVQGGIQIKRKFPEAVLIFILPPSLKELEKRLRSRAMENEADIQKRLKIAKEEITKSPEYDYIVLNNTLEHCVQQLKSIIIAQRCKSKQQISLVESILSNS